MNSFGFRHIIKKIAEINNKTQRILEKSPQKETEYKELYEELYKENIYLFDETEKILKEEKDNLTELNKKQKTAVNNMDIKQVGENITKENKIEKDVKEIGNNVVQIFEIATPYGFMRYIAKEILETFKEIDEKIKKFNEKTEEFGDKLVKNNINKNMENIRNFDIEKVRKNGIFAIDDKTLNSISEINNLQENLIQNNVIDAETSSMLKKGQFEEIAKKIAEKTIPMAGLISGLIDFNKKTKEIVEGISDYVKNQELGIPGSQIIQNQLQDMDSEKISKISKIVLNFAEKTTHPYAQAVVKGIRTISKLQQESRTKKEKEREIGI